jgi:hypothetical protein
LRAAKPFSSPTLRRSSCVVFLEGATLAYLSLPVLLWLLGWLRVYLALPLALGLVASAIMAWRQTRRHSSSADFVCTEPDLPLWPFLGALVLALIWGIYSGAGGFTYTSPDWSKHYAMMRDLTEGAWPVTYTIDGESSGLVFYLAYYLPAAAVAKMFGWWCGCLILCLWTCLGTMLALSWFCLLIGRAPLLAAFLFIFSNGLDFIGDRLVRGGPLLPGTEHIDWWAGLLNLPGHYSQLVWAPQHSLAAWIVTGLLAVQISSQRGLGHALFLIALTFFWSPFTLIGIIPLALYTWIKSRCRGAVSFPNLIALVLIAVSTLFYLSRSHPSPHGFLWDLTDLRMEWPRLLLVHLLEWFLFFLFARELRKSENLWLRGFFWVAAGTLLFLPFYSYGYANDWAMRASIPALYLLWTGVIRSLLNPHPDLEVRLLLVLVLFGTFGALHESSKTWNLPHTELVGQEVYPHVPGLDEPYRSQYLGSLDSFFFQNLAAISIPLQLKTPLTP